MSKWKTNWVIAGPGPLCPQSERDEALDLLEAVTQAWSHADSDWNEKRKALLGRLRVKERCPTCNAEWDRNIEYKKDSGCPTCGNLCYRPKKTVREQVEAKQSFDIIMPGIADALLTLADAIDRIEARLNDR